MGASRALRRVLFRPELKPALQAMATECLAAVAEAVDTAKAVDIATPQNDEVAGQDATAEQSLEIIRGANQGRSKATSWQRQLTPDDMKLVDSRNAAEQTKTQARTVKITGATAGAPRGVNLGELRRLRLSKSRCVHRQAVLAGGCGGSSICTDRQPCGRQCAAGDGRVGHVGRRCRQRV